MRSMGSAQCEMPEAAASSTKMIGIQAGAVSFVDEGAEQALDVFQQRGAVNTIFLATFTYGRGIAGRQVPGQPLPDSAIAIDRATGRVRVLNRGSIYGFDISPKGDEIVYSRAPD